MTCSFKWENYIIDFAYSNYEKKKSVVIYLLIATFPSISPLFMQLIRRCYKIGLKPTKTLN